MSKKGSKVFGQPAVEHFLGNARVDVYDQGLVREPLGPLARRLLLRFWIGDRYVVKVIPEIREVVSPVRLRVESDGLRIVRVLQVRRAGNPQHARQIRQPVEGPAALRRAQAQ